MSLGLDDRKRADSAAWDTDDIDQCVSLIAVHQSADRSRAQLEDRPVYERRQLVRRVHGRVIVCNLVPKVPRAVPQGIVGGYHKGSGCRGELDVEASGVKSQECQERQERQESGDEETTLESSSGDRQRGTHSIGTREGLALSLYRWLSAPVLLTAISPHLAHYSPCAAGSDFVQLVSLPS